MDDFENAIEISDVNILNRGFKMEKLNLNIKKGFITVITGGVGSGKTTLVEAIAGINEITRGDIIINGHSLLFNPFEAKNELGFIFHDWPFPMTASVENCGRLFGEMYKDFDMGRYKSICKEFGIGMNLLYRQMSKGQAIKVQLAFALAHDAKVLLFDDATEGLDPVFRMELRGRLSNYVSDGEHTVLMSTKIYEDMDKNIDYFVALRYGSVICQMDMEEIKEKYPDGVKGFLKEYGNKKTDRIWSFME